MNKQLLLLTAVLALASGCATKSTTSPSALTPAEQVAITTAAEIGTEAALTKNPTDVVYFVAGAEVLESVASGTNVVTVTTIEDALEQSEGGVNANPLVLTAITGGLNIADAYLDNQSVTNSPLQQSTALRSVSGWIATGINEGIALTPQLKPQ